MGYPMRVAIDDRCDGCGDKHHSTGVAFGVGKAVICVDCIVAGVECLTRRAVEDLVGSGSAIVVRVGKGEN